MVVDRIKEDHVGQERLDLNLKNWSQIWKGEEVPRAWSQRSTSLVLLAPDQPGPDSAEDVNRGIMESMDAMRGSLQGSPK